MSRQLLAQVFNKTLSDFRGDREKYDHYLEQKERYATWLSKTSDTKSKILEPNKSNTVTLVLKNPKEISDIPKWWFLKDSQDSCDALASHPAGKLATDNNGTAIGSSANKNSTNKNATQQDDELILAERLFPSATQTSTEANYLVVSDVKPGSVADFCDVRAGFFLKSLTLEGQGTLTPDFIKARITREQVFLKAQTVPSLTMEFMVNHDLLDLELRVALTSGWSPGNYNFLDAAENSSNKDPAAGNDENSSVNAGRNSAEHEARVLREEKRKCLRIRYIIESEERLRSLMEAPWDVALQNKSAGSGGPLFTSEGQVYQHPFRSTYTRLLSKYAHQSDFDLAEGNVEILKEILNLESLPTAVGAEQNYEKQTMMSRGGYYKDMWRRRAEAMIS